jgi:hypothetical protein
LYLASCIKIPFSFQNNVTYFVHRIDPLMYLVAVFATHRLERDPSIRGFLAEMGNDLRCTRVFAALKPGNK